jgi:hypothetical protein
MRLWKFEYAQISPDICENEWMRCTWCRSICSGASWYLCPLVSGHSIARHRQNRTNNNPRRNRGLSFFQNSCESEGVSWVVKVKAMIWREAWMCGWLGAVRPRPYMNKSWRSMERLCVALSDVFCWSHCLGGPEQRECHSLLVSKLLLWCYWLYLWKQASISCDCCPSTSRCSSKVRLNIDLNIDYKVVY